MIYELARNDKDKAIEETTLKPISKNKKIIKK